MSLMKMLDRTDPVLAPLVLNPLMAKVAEQAGFDALYLGGGATGYAKTSLEANLSLTEMAQTGVEIGAVSAKPLILDGACGWGDPMHLHHTIHVTEAAGFAAIEIEDQLLPKRAHHHIGIEHMIDTDLMVAKVAEAISAKRDPEFVVIARTNAVRVTSIDDAVDRLERYHNAGADALLALVRTPEEARYLGERLPAPLVYLCPPGGLAHFDMTPREMGELGYKLLCDTSTGLLAIYETVKSVYENLGADFADRRRSSDEWRDIQNNLHTDIGLDQKLDVEVRTVESKP
ncbi:MAG: isocitrate lyase/PEP mutase family protein [Pseudomonadota bacterium]